jgi:DNA-binding transcriptional LysR family regulator
MINTFKSARPDVVVVERTLGLTTQEYALQQGQVDAVFNVGVPGCLPFQVQHLRQEPRLVVMPAGHRLAEKDVVELSDVLGERFVRLHPAIPRWCQHLFTLTAERGGPGRLSSNDAGSTEEVLAAVGDNNLFSAPAESAAHLRVPHLRWREVSGVTPVSLDLVTDSRNPHPELPVLARVASLVVAQGFLRPEAHAS